MSMNTKAQENSSKNNNRFTWEGCSVLLDINDGERMVFERLTAAATLKIGNKKCSLQPLIGCPFGSLFQVENGTDGPFLSRIFSTSEGNNDLQEENESPTIHGSKDNRELVDNNTAQSLTGEDVDEMRRKGASGDEIIEALITNSATFEKKTSFSQEKYRLKKQKKYSPRVLLRRPGTRSICEAYFKKRPEQIGFLRMDTLALLLSMANVTSHSDVLVVDMVGGLLTGVVAERLGGNGYVCNTYRGITPYPIDIVRMFNFGEKICERIVSSSWAELRATSNVTSISSDQLEDACNTKSQSNEEITMPSEDGNTKISPEISASPALKPCKATKAGQKAPLDTIKSWRENGFSSLIIAAPQIDAWSMVKELLPLLSFSAPFAVYHQYQQPLAICMHNLQVGKMAVGLQISEPWLREYQAEIECLYDEECRLDNCIREMHEKMSALEKAGTSQRTLYLTAEDIMSQPCFRNKIVITVKAPHASTVEVPDPDEDIAFPERQYRLIVRSTTGPIDLDLLSNYGEHHEDVKVKHRKSLDSSTVNGCRQVVDGAYYSDSSGLQRSDESGIHKIIPLDGAAKDDYWLRSDYEVTATDLWGKECS